MSRADERTAEAHEKCRLSLCLNRKARELCTGLRPQGAPELPGESVEVLVSEEIPRD